MIMKKLFLIVFTSISVLYSYAQEAEITKGEKISGAFKSTRVINAHSIEMLEKGYLDVRILHRFGYVSDGIKQLFGLDAASMRLGFDYGINDNLTIGVGRSTFRKEIDAFVKSRLMQQTKGGKKEVPFSLIVAGGYAVHTEEIFAGPKQSIVDRSSYYVQLLVGKKFNETFAMQLSPIFVHTNFPVVLTDDQNIFAMGIGARYKISRITAITLDYHAKFGKLDPAFKNPLSVGVDISTGGHTFQLQFSNTAGMNERAYITQTTGDFFKGNIRMGFNLSRLFDLGKD
jgi:hypothetical protein